MFSEIRPLRPLMLAALLACTTLALSADERGLDFEQLAAIRTVGSVQVSPDGSLIAYTRTVPRHPGVDEDGAAWSELHLVPSSGEPGRALVHGEINVSEVRFTPDGRYLTYLAKRDEDEETALWAIPVDGGESRRLLSFDTAIESYRLSPDAGRVAFVAREAEDEKRESAREKGYTAEVYEEDWRHRRAWLAGLPPWEPATPVPGQEEPEPDEPRQLEIEGSVFEIEWSPDGQRLAVTSAATPLIDDRYMRRRIRIVDRESGEIVGRIENPGKLGDFRFSPDGKHLALISAADWNDPRDGRLLLAPATGGELRDLLPGLEGHVSRIAWQDADTVMYVADVWAETEFGEVELGGQRKSHLVSGGRGRAPVLTGLSLSGDGQLAAFVGETPRHPAEVFVMAHGERLPRRLTDSNPWLAEIPLARQETRRFRARDGLELEGVLLHPLHPVHGERAPLLLMVHGGPEGHDRNGWVTSYSRPGQLATARGYAVFYPNYRGSTGRGVAFSKLGQGDAGGREFDDLVDAVDHLAEEGRVDRERVGITGGSYGGYATGWCSTYHTERFRAGVMFVGISNKVSKGLTTEIPVEDRAVHTLFDPWQKWQFSLERSPIFHAEKSRTALMIAGGTADSRVHPSQSLQLYRALKLIGETPVRYVRYPGEGHGNRKAAARDDYTRRLLRWMDWFVVDGRQELPPWRLELPMDAEDDEGAGDDDPAG